MTKIKESKNLPEPEFTEDFREENPRLHALYTRQALRFLVISDIAKQIFGNQSNIQADEFAVALQETEEKLIRENAAFYCAKELIEEQNAARRAYLDYVKAELKEE